jgi:hypothetical protein
MKRDRGRIDRSIDRIRSSSGHHSCH